MTDFLTNVENFLGLKFSKPHYPNSPASLSMIGKEILSDY